MWVILNPREKAKMNTRWKADYLEGIRMQSLVWLFKHANDTDLKGDLKHNCNLQAYLLGIWPCL